MEPNLKIRLERAESWLRLAKSISASGGTDPSMAVVEHERFLFYWIAFNSLYGRHQGHNQTREDADDIDAFLGKVERMTKWDSEEGTLIVQSAVNDPETLRFGQRLIQDYFLDKRYWEPRFHIDDVKKKCEEEWLGVKRALSKGRYQLFMVYSIKRLRILRNQIMHGSVTYGKQSKGWESLVIGVPMLSRLVSVFAELVSQYGDRLDWEPAPYPRLGHPGHPRKSPIRIR